ncbi:cellulose-binding domain-containing protein [Streptomyces sp. NRRL F-5123]|uniref:cellulose-binding domain-containing protein n=1 Tax=Streptomyces sp. NRRL F-5123 TaxID=1463856 RepID=UPI0007C5A326|nr:cellulose-binding domain-containing protein [Streptomyces sp. NRRL F-5123]
MKHDRILPALAPDSGGASARSGLRTGSIAAATAVLVAAAALTALHPAVSQASPAVNSNALYVAPSGTAGASGSQSDPTTLASAVTRITAGGTIYLRGGTYNLAQTVTIAAGNNGTSSARKEISAYPGETPVLDFSAQSESSSNRGVALNGSYWHLYGLTVEHAGDNGISVGGSNNVIERTVTAYNHDTGLQISRADSSTSISAWPSNNLVVSSESHDNADSGGENADGFAAKLTVGTGNVFRYDVSHNNIDDGWDLYTKTDTGPIGPVTSTERNFSFDAGTSTFRSNTSCRSGSGSNDKVVGDADSSNQFWSGSNGSRCSSYSGALGWSFASDGTLDVTFGGSHVTGGSTTTGGTTTTGGSTTTGTSAGTTTGGTTTTGGSTTGGTGSGPGCTASYVPSTWSGGFTANVTVTDTGSTAVNGWTVAFTLPSGQAVTSAWNATISPASGAVTATNLSYNAQIPAGGSQSFGFQGSYTGSFAQPTHFTLNGTACATG